jgi:heptosyltransferase-3
MSMAPAPAPPRRALVVKLGHIGDVVVATPVLSALKRAWPGLELDLLVNQGTEAVVEHHPLVGRLLVLERGRRGPAELAYQAGLVRRLRRRRYDLCLELSGGDRGAFLAWASGARLRVGFAPKRRSLRGRAFHRLADGGGTDRHQVQAFLRQVRALGLEPGEPGLSLEPGPAARRAAGELMAGHGLEPGGFAVVHPTSRWMFKCWTPQGNAALIRRLHKRGLAVALTAAPAPAELAFARRVRALLPPEARVADLAGRLDLQTLAALIGRARVFCGVDSAPMHMAAALGTPVLTMFGPSGERMWGPWQAAAEVLVGECPEHHCGRDGCQGGKVSRCLEQLPPERALAALDRLLEST